MSRSVTAIDLEVSEDLAEIIASLREVDAARPMRSSVASLVSDPGSVAVVITLLQGPLTVAELTQVGHTWFARWRRRSHDKGKLRASGPAGMVEVDIDEDTDFEAIGRALEALLFPQPAASAKGFDADDLDD